MDCADCTMHVRHAIAALPGVEAVDVFLASEKAVVRLDPSLVGLPAIQRAVEGAGYHALEPDLLGETETQARRFTRQVLTLFGLVFGLVLFVVVIGEWLGFFEAVTERVPWPVGLAIVVIAGYPVFLNVIRAALKRQIISHTLMTVGVLAALAVGEWATAVVVVFFMRVGDFAEHFTTERARRAVKDLTALAPQQARVEREGAEVEVPIAQVMTGDVVIVRPGEPIPVDGEVIAGQATVNQATITGESMPVETGPGAKVFAATLATLGSLKVRAEAVGRDTTFGRVIKLVEEAEAHRADVQRIADRFSAYFLPVVATIALLTFMIRRDPLATAAVLVVACSCSFALATPIAMLASIGSAARHGLMIKGGKYLELLARADTLLIDKTGTLTLGKPRIVDFIAIVNEEAAASNDELIGWIASAERYSEHPLAEAVRAEARSRGAVLVEPQEFRSLPGAGVQALVDGRLVAVGSLRLAGPIFGDRSEQAENGKLAPLSPGAALQAQTLQDQGMTLLAAWVDGIPRALLAAADTLRPEVPQAIQELRALGIGEIELLTGDNERTASSLAEQLGVRCRANLLPEDKIRIVKDYQAQGRTVVMVGDGVNDAPALAQAEVGIAMGAAGSGVALEAAHIALMREDWTLVPEIVRIARRTMKVVKTNIAFTAVYNLLGLSLAALGFLPPIFAAAAQSLPDLGILANSTRLLRQK